MEKIDDITAGIVTANKALVVDSNKDLSSNVGAIRNLTITGTFTDGTASLDGGVLSNVVSATIKSSVPTLTIESTNEDGSAGIILISDKHDDAGDAFKMNLSNGTFTIKSDHTTKSNFSDTFLTLSNEDDGTRTTVSGNLVVTGNIEGTWNGVDITCNELDMSTFNSTHFEISGGEFSLKSTLLTGVDSNFSVLSNIVSLASTVTIQNLLIGDGSNDALVKPNGDYNLVLRSSYSGASQANIIIGKGENGNINLKANGSGYIDCESNILVSNIISTTDQNIELSPGGTGSVVLNSKIFVTTVTSSGDITLTPGTSNEIISTGGFNLKDNDTYLKINSGKLQIYSTTTGSTDKYLTFSNLNTEDATIFFGTYNSNRTVYIEVDTLKFSGDSMEINRSNDYYNFDTNKLRSSEIIGSETEFGDINIDSTSHSSKGNIKFNSNCLVKEDMKLQFRDTDIYISSVSDGSLTMRANNNVYINVNGTDQISINNTNTVFGTNIIIPDGGTIGSSNNMDALSISSTGVINISTFENSTTTLDGALVIAGGLGVGKTLNIGQDLALLSDSPVIHFGTDKDINITHNHNSGLTLLHTSTNNNTPFILTLASKENDIQTDDVISTLNFQSLGDTDSGDAIKICAGIEAIAENNFTNTNNSTKLSFKTASNDDATEKMSLSSSGILNVQNSVKINNTQIISSQKDAEVDVSLTSSTQSSEFNNYVDVTSKYNETQADIVTLKNTINSLLEKLRNHGLIAT